MTHKLNHYIYPANSRSCQGLLGVSPEDAVNKARIMTDIPGSGIDTHRLVALSARYVEQPYLQGKPTYIYDDAQRVADGANMTLTLRQVD